MVDCCSCAAKAGPHWGPAGEGAQGLEAEARHTVELPNPVPPDEASLTGDQLEKASEST